MLNLQSIYFGQKHKDFTADDYDLIRKIARLAHKHQIQATNDCNGEGFVNGQHYYNGQIDDWAKREYGQGVKSAYIDNSEETIFTQEMDKIEDKMNGIIAEANTASKKPLGLKPWFIVYQGDPRGNTVKLTYEGDFIEL